jgi:hypothetical protein
MTTAMAIASRPASVLAAKLEKTGAERRLSPRYQTLISGLITLERGQGEMPCYILNVSDTGALLRPYDVLLCPSQFTLRPELGAARKCEIVWTNGRMLAVRFLGENAPPLSGREWASLDGTPDPIEVLAN